MDSETSDIYTLSLLAALPIYWKNQRQLLCSDIIVPARCVAVYFMPDAGLFCYGNNECRTCCAFCCAANLKEIFENSNDCPIIKLHIYESADNDASRK